MKKELRTLKYLESSFYDFMDDRIQDEKEREVFDDPASAAIEDYMAEVHDSCLFPKAWQMYIDQLLFEGYNSSYPFCKSEEHDKDLEEYRKGINKQHINESQTNALLQDCIIKGYNQYRDVRQQDVLLMCDAWRDDWRINPIDMFQDFVYPFIMEQDKDLYMIADNKALANYCAGLVKTMYFEY